MSEEISFSMPLGTSGPELSSLSDSLGVSDTLAATTYAPDVTNVDSTKASKSMMDFLKQKWVWFVLIVLILIAVYFIYRNMNAKKEKLTNDNQDEDETQPSDTTI